MRAAPKFATNVEALTVNRPHAGKSLQDFLAARLGLSRRAAKAVIDGRSVWVNRRCVWIAHHPLKTGDAVEIPRSVVAAARRQAGSAQAAVAPEERRHVRVLVETPDYIVADKPAGLLANDDPKSVEAILRTQLKEPNLQAVHRLDRDTTGCLLFAKTFAAYQLARRMGWTRLLVLTFKPAVRNAWETDLLTHRDFEGWQFVTRGGTLTAEDVDKERPVVCFGSFQDLLGRNRTGGIKERNEWIHLWNWDCVILTNITTEPGASTPRTSLPPRTGGNASLPREKD